MRILVLTSTFPRWSGDREPPFVFELCRRLARAHDVLVLAPHSPGAAREESLGERLRVRRFRYAPTALESLAYQGGILEKLRAAPWRWLLVPLFCAAQWLAARRAAAHWRPHAIHAHWIVPQGLVAVLARRASTGHRAAVVCTSHGADLFALRGRLAMRIKAWVLRRIDALTVVSQAMRAPARELGARDDGVFVLSMGVDARARFVPGAPGERAADEVLYVGRLVRKKGVGDLVDAFARLGGHPHARLTIVGTGPLEREIRDQVERSGLAARVTFAGAIPNDQLAPFYRRASVAVVPSVVARDGDQEGLGLVIAEAMACECPVVASDLPAIRDIVQHGVTGFLARPGDAGDFAEKIAAVLRDPAQAASLAREGRRLVLERFDWQGVGQRYEDLLSSVALSSVAR